MTEITNRDVARMALPFTSLSKRQWNVLTKHLEITESDPELHEALTLAISNQARIEVVANYRFYSEGFFEASVDEDSVTNLPIL